jgi:hypothetical protein
LEHRAYIPDLSPSVYYPFALLKEDHGGLRFEEYCESEATVRGSVAIKERPAVNREQ